MQKEAKSSVITELYVDCQILQTAAFDRGMGKYTSSLLNALITQNNKAHKYDKITVLLSKNLDISKQRIAAIKRLTTSESLVLLDLPTDISINLEEKNATAKKVLNQYIELNKTAGASADFLIMAPFFVGFCSVFPSVAGIRKYSIVYDITPQKIEHIQKIFPDELYYSHYQILLEADHLFTISNAVKNDLENFIGISQAAMTSIDGAPFVGSVEEKASDDVRAKYKVPYIHLPSGPMVHKNNERAVRAFAKFNGRHNGKFTLYITSTFDDATKEKLHSLSDNIVFTGNVSDEEMHAAFKGASAILFPSLAEGLGMPVLEASLYDTPVACSDIPVLSELSSDGFYLFDPTSIDSICGALDNAVNKQDWDSRHAALELLRNKYTWQNSADTLYAGLGKQRKKPGINKVLVLEATSGPAVEDLATCLYGQITSRTGNRVLVSKKDLQDSPLSYYARSTSDVSEDDMTRLRVVGVKPPLLGLFSRNRKIQLILDGEVIETVSASPKYKDKALEVPGWHYNTSSLQAVTVSKIADIIDNNLVKL